MKKIFSLFAAILFAGSLWAVDVSFAFSTIGSTGWTNSYADHSVTCTDGTVYMKASKQTGTITDYPVTKGQPVSFVLSDNTKSLSAISFTCQQWGTKAQTITLKYSTNGGSSYSALNPSVTSTNFSISSSSLPSGTNAVQITFSSTSNQVGIVSMSYTLASGGGSDPVAVTGVELDESTIELEVGETQKLTATVAPGNATNKSVTWESDDEDVATVEGGVVTAVGEGTANITVTTVDGSFTAECEVTVTPALPKSTLTFTAKCNGSGTADDGAGWTIASDATESNFDTDRGIHYGTNSATVQYLRLSTSDIDGTIRKIVVNASAGSDATVSITVGGDAFGGDAKALTSYAEAYTFKGSASGEIIVSIEKEAAATKGLYCKSIVVSYEEAAVAQPIIAPTATKFIREVEVSFSTTTDGATIYYTTKESAKETPATSGDWAAYDSENKPTFDATTTIWAAAKKGDAWSTIASKTFTRLPIDHAGSAEDPYTVAEARTAIDENMGVADVCATGTVSQIVTELSDGKITYNISADGLTTSAQLQAYKGLGVDGANFTDETAVQVGDVVVIRGNLLYYTTTSTYEFAQGNQLVSVSHPVVPSIICPASINAPAAETAAVLTVTYSNIAEINANIKFYESDGETEATYDWFDAEINADNNVYYVVGENTNEETRTAYFKVYVGEVYSNLVTVTQAAFVPDYATLPFAFDGGQADIASKNGLTEDGIATKDYASSPKLKFDNTGDYLVLKINEAASLLTFDINGNGFSGGTFKVQTSADGIDYDDLETYTELGATQSEMFNIDADVRFIKWVYTTKSSGNVGLGNITVSKHTYTLQWSIGTSVEPLGTMLLQGETSSYKVEIALKDVRANTYKVEVFQEGVAEHVGVANLEIAEDGKYWLRFIFDSSESDPTKALDIDTDRKGDATSVDNTDATKKAVKFIQNGQLFIELNGHIYNVQGQTVK